jgi:hypothetical protein
MLPHRLLVGQLHDLVEQALAVGRVRRDASLAQNTRSGDEVFGEVGAGLGLAQSGFE